MFDTQVNPASALDPKKLYRAIEDDFADVAARDERTLLRSLVARAITRLGTECPVRAVATIRCDPDQFDAEGNRDLVDRLIRRFSTGAGPASVTPLADPRLVTWSLRGHDQWAVEMLLEREPTEKAAFGLHLAYLAVQQRLTESGWVSLMDRARAIQSSLLPQPPFAVQEGFDVHARSESAELVGGDAYDVRRLTGAATTSIVVADASGHGLPAALQARDVVIGLRMGSDNSLKIVATIEKLNRLLCESSLSSQFTSLLFGEIYEDGMFLFVNAGHPSAVLIDDGDISSLGQTGPVLGVSPFARYTLGHARLGPGAMLLLFSDGVIECPSPAGEEFGMERLIASGLTAGHGASARNVCDAVFDSLHGHRQSARLPDDATVLCVRRLTTQLHTPGAQDSR